MADDEFIKNNNFKFETGKKTLSEEAIATKIKAFNEDPGRIPVVQGFSDGKSSSKRLGTQARPLSKLTISTIKNKTR